MPDKEDIYRTLYEASEDLRDTEDILVNRYIDADDELTVIQGIRDSLELFLKKPELLLDPTERSYLLEIEERLKLIRVSWVWAYAWPENGLVGTVENASRALRYLGNLEETTKLIDNAPFSNSQIILPFEEAISKLICRLGSNPNAWYALGPRKFEEILAEIWTTLGWETILTPPSRDGGVDIRAIRNENGIWLCYLIEAKAYNPNRPVGIEIVRSLYGVVERERASHGIIATTSHFTRGAKEESRVLRYRVSLAAFEDVLQWAREYRKRMNK